jgi:hypothetical protein
LTPATYRPLVNGVRIDRPLTRRFQASDDCLQRGKKGFALRRGQDGKQKGVGF